MLSPCTRVCQLDTVSGWCTGCGRSLPEIARWTEADAEERDAIVAELPARMAILKRGGR